MAVGERFSLADWSPAPVAPARLPRLCQPRPPAIPAAVSQLKKYDPTDPNRRQLERDLEAEAGGAGQYSVDLNSTHTRARARACTGGRALTRLRALPPARAVDRRQRTTSSRTPSGSTTSSPRSGTARTSPTLSIPTSRRSCSRWSARRRSSSRAASTTTTTSRWTTRRASAPSWPRPSAPARPSTCSRRASTRRAAATGPPCRARRPSRCDDVRKVQNCVTAGVSLTRRASSAFGARCR